MTVALAWTPPTETVWKTNLSAHASGTLVKIYKKMSFRIIPFLGKFVNERLQVLLCESAMSPESLGHLVVLPVNPWAPQLKLGLRL